MPNDPTAIYFYPHDRDRDWMRSAACRDADADLFFPEHRGPRDVKEAKELCLSCPVRPDCLKYALNNRIQHGIWGGKSEKERRKMRWADGRQVRYCETAACSQPFHPTRRFQRYCPDCEGETG